MNASSWAIGDVASALLLAIASLVVLAAVVRERTRRRYRQKMRRHLQQFTPVPQLGLYEETRPRLYVGGRRLEHAVLLLHGYSGSPLELAELSGALERAGIPFYVPLLTGFGLDDFRLLYQVAPCDWLRDAIIAYDLLATMAERVSVVGQSSGGTLAVYVASQRPVKHLVLVGPNLIPSPSDAGVRKLVTSPIWGRALRLALPVFAKPVRPGRVTFSDTVDPDAAGRAFSYPTLPLHSLRAQWALQDMVDISRARFERLTIAYGAQDVTVDNGALLKLLDQRGIPYQKLVFLRSGHNIFQDYDREEAAQAVAEVLKS